MTTKKKSKGLFGGWLDKLDKRDDELGALEDFDSTPFWTPRRYASTDYLDEMWSKRSFRATDFQQDQDLVTAHQMVSSFVNALSRGAGYIVLFDSSTSTAGTDMKKKKVYITTAPVIDKSIDAKQAGRVLTGLGVHEICHPRYGTDTSSAVRAIWPTAVIASKVSNLLDDIRIEARFVKDYPGYSGVFAPMLDYIEKAGIKKMGVMSPSKANIFDIGIAATRYPGAVDWTGWEAERRWWLDWAARWAPEDSPRRHVMGVREALRHMAAAAERERETGDKRKEGPGKGQQAGRSDGIGDGEGDSGEVLGGDDVPDAFDQRAEESSDDQLPVSIRITSSELPDDSGTQAVNEAAQANGVSEHSTQTTNSEADSKVKDAQFIEQTAYGPIEIVRTPQQLPIDMNAIRFTRSDLAARYVRDALMRSRTGHTGESRHRKHGKLDRHALSRSVHGDYRLFSKRQSQSRDKFNIWLMIDVSGSMSGHEVVQAAQVATAIAEGAAHFRNVRVSVWAWSNAFRREATSYGDNNPGAVRLWSTGEPIRLIQRLIDLKKGGTPDATVMDWAGKAVLQDTHVGERPVILMCSDGSGQGMMNQAVERARDRGVEVYGVSFGLSDSALRERYGDDCILWNNSIVETAKPLADLVARMVAHRGSA